MIPFYNPKNSQRVYKMEALAKMSRQLLVIVIYKFVLRSTFPFDPPKNMRKPNISYPLIRTCLCACQRVNVRFSDILKGIKRKQWE